MEPADNSTERMTIRVVTGSMAPTIEPGQLVTVERRPPEPGDIAAFVAGETIMVHRVLARWDTCRGLYYLHRGDASRQSGVFRGHQLVGVVSGHESHEPQGFERARYWFMGHVARAGAAFASASELRPLFNWFVLAGAEPQHAHRADAREPQASPRPTRESVALYSGYVASADACGHDDPDPGFDAFGTLRNGRPRTQEPHSP